MKSITCRVLPYLAVVLLSLQITSAHAQIGDSDYGPAIRGAAAGGSSPDPDRNFAIGSPGAPVDETVDANMGISPGALQAPGAASPSLNFAPTPAQGATGRPSPAGDGSSNTLPAVEQPGAAPPPIIYKTAPKTAAPSFDAAVGQKVEPQQQTSPGGDYDVWKRNFGNTQ